MTYLYRSTRKCKERLDIDMNNQELCIPDTVFPDSAVRLTFYSNSLVNSAADSFFSLTTPTRFESPRQPLKTPTLFQPPKQLSWWQVMSYGLAWTG